MFSNLFAQVSDENYASRILAEKVIVDFNQGVKKYNFERSKELPEIIKIDDFYYTLSISSNHLRFSIVNYLKEEIIINGQLVKFKKLRETRNTTSFLSIFLKDAQAAEALDAGSTFLLLKALGELDKTLKDTGMLCLSESCKQETRSQNIKKIMTTLRRQKDDCELKQIEMSNAIKSFEHSGSLYSFPMTISNEYNSVKEFMNLLVKSNKKNIESFINDKLAIDSKKYNTCSRVLVIGSTLEPLVKATEGTFGNLTRYAQGQNFSDSQQKEYDRIIESCEMMDELKTCIITLQNQTITMNNEKRKQKERLDVFPDAERSFKDMVR
jgi:hypothetical protein